VWPRCALCIVDVALVVVVDFDGDGDVDLVDSL